jgi:methylenetetrahydrofolate reductase (NADPH)
VAAVWERGTRLPIHIGLPGAVPCVKLRRISERIGVGDSIGLLRDEGDFVPGPLVAGLQESFGERPPNVAGFHIFTFNDLASTERWRQQVLERLQPA